MPDVVWHPVNKAPALPLLSPSLAFTAVTSIQAFTLFSFTICILFTLTLGSVFPPVGADPRASGPQARGLPASQAPRDFAARAEPAPRSPTPAAFPHWGDEALTLLPTSPSQAGDRIISPVAMRCAIHETPTLTSASRCSTKYPFNYTPLL